MSRLESPRSKHHCGVLLEVEWVENVREYQVGRLVTAYHKTNVTVLRSFLRVNSHCGQVMEVVWGKFGNVLRK